MSACTRAMLQTLIRLAHQTKRHMPFAFGIMKLAVPRPVRRGLYRRYFEREINQNATVQTIFENIYNRNWWQSGESRSGTGSELAQTNELSRALEGWLVRHAAEISTVLDAPCGDFNWMRGVSLPGNMHYIGGDIVRELVALNSARFQSPRRTFIELDIIDGPLPTADAWLCRDALIHFPYSAGIAVLSKFRSSSIKYFLGTTYTNVENRQDIPFGMWRPINLVVHPFNLGEPFELIADSRAGREQHRYLGVWSNPKS